MGHKRISEWENSSQVFEHEFFLTFKEFKDLYAKAMDQYNQFERSSQIKSTPQFGKPRKKRFKPIEQLSAKGLALMSYLYAIKDHNKKQPIIASSVNDFKHMIRLIDKAQPGTKVTVTFQSIDAPGQFWPRVISKSHKTLVKLERTEDGVRIIHMDPTNNSLYGQYCQSLAVEALEENVKMTQMPKEHPVVLKPTALKFAYQRNPKNPKADSKKPQTAVFSRQVNEYECGVIVSKDGRVLNRDDHFSDQVFTIENYDASKQYYLYDLPPQHLKSVQSRPFAEYVLKEHGDKKANRSQKTLAHIYQKHPELSYTQHFSEKMRGSVLGYLHKYKENPKKIMEDVAMYDAANMTLERLNAEFGPPKALQARSQNIEVKNVEEKAPVEKKKLEIKPVIHGLHGKQNRGLSKPPGLKRSLSERSPLTPSPMFFSPSTPSKKAETPKGSKGNPVNKGPTKGHPPKGSSVSAPGPTKKY